MDDADNHLPDRLADLETRVAILQDQVDRLSRRLEAAEKDPTPVEDASVVESSITSEEPSAKTTTDSEAQTEPQEIKGTTEPPRPAKPRPKATPPKPDRKPSALKSVEWLQKLGIGLLLLGLVFLFKYSIDQGWLTPAIRVGFGAVLGVFLLGAGFKVRSKQVRLGQVLLGGGAATFYVTLFAAYQLYDLLPYPLAFAGMVVVTLMTFYLAIWQNDVVLAIIATAGGLGTPFLLYTGEGNVPGLVTYTCLILACTITLFLFKGWRSLVFSSALGGVLVFAIGGFDLWWSQGGDTTDAMYYQLGIIICWLMYGGIPTVRELLRQRDAEAWAMPPLQVFKGVGFIEQPAYLLTLGTPLLAYALSRDVWDWSDTTWGIIALVLVGLYAVAYTLLRERGLTSLAQVYGLVAASMLAIAGFELFQQDNHRLLVLAFEAMGLHLLARFLPDRAFRFAGHCLGFVLFFILSYRLLELDGAAPIFLNSQALVDIAILALAVVTAWSLTNKRLQFVYGLVAYIGLLGWLWRDLVALPSGQAYVSIAWGICALTALVLGWQRDADGIRNAGLITLLIVVGKLFIIDLAKLEAIWRILLFLGFGGLLLLLSYFFPSLWRPKSEPEENPAPAEV